MIDINIEKIKKESNNEVNTDQLKLFFDKVKIISDNKDKLVADMVEQIYKFVNNKGKFLEVLGLVNTK